MSVKTVLVDASKLKMDFGLYPRSRLDDTHVGHLKDALEAGTVLPPIIVWRKTKKVVDGFHRTTAYTAIYGPNAKIPAEFRDYKNDAEFFRESMDLNTQHGENICVADRARCVAISRGLGIPEDVIAGTLHVTIEKMKAIEVTYNAVINKTTPIILKRAVLHLGGQSITKKQAAGIPHLGGNQQGFMVNQVITLIENDLLNKNNSNLMDRLLYLYNLLEDMFGSVASVSKSTKVAKQKKR